MEDHRPRWGGWTSNPDGAASGPRQVRLLWSSAKTSLTKSSALSSTYKSLLTFLWFSSVDGNLRLPTEIQRIAWCQGAMIGLLGNMHTWTSDYFPIRIERQIPTQPFWWSQRNGLKALG